MTTGTTPHVVVIGGGITGLAAAFYLKDEPVRVTVLEGAGRLGGKLAASDVAGVAMDEGAEALLAPRSALATTWSPRASPPPRSTPGARCGRCPAGSSWACPPIWMSWPPPG